MMPLTLPNTILMTADTMGGVWTYALELTRALRKSDVHVHLATMGNRLNRNQRKATSRIPNLTVHESTYALEWMDDPWEDVNAAGKWLLELEREIRPDLVHLNNYVHGALDWHAPVLITGHSCVLSWWQAVKKEEAPSTWKTYTTKVREGLRKADYVVGVTRYMLKRLEKYYGPFKSSGVVYNARDESRFHALPKKQMIFSMGRLWDEAKNIRILNDISSELEWPVYVAGEDRGRLSSNGQVYNNIELLGHLGETKIAAWLSKTSIYVMPARYEPFGLSVLEAALSGCALVLGDIPSLREVWNDAAVYVDPDDPDDLKQRIRELEKNEELREIMAQKSLNRAGRYSFDRFACRYTMVYQMLLQKDKPRPGLARPGSV